MVKVKCYQSMNQIISESACLNVERLMERLKDVPKDYQLVIVKGNNRPVNHSTVSNTIDIDEWHKQVILYI